MDIIPFKWKDNRKSVTNNIKEKNESNYLINNIKEINALKYIANNIHSKNERIIWFPNKIDTNKDLQSFIEVYEDFDFKNNIHNAYISTGNLIGVVNYTNNDLSVTVEIGSRFDMNEQQPFLMYMLSNVFQGAITDHGVDLNTSDFWDMLLIFVFGYQLQKALQQGLYKKYKMYEINDFNFKGTLDVANYIKKNTPFLGKVSFKKREHTFDNDIILLIRHTLNVIQRGKYSSLWNAIFGNSDSIIRAMKAIKEVTPSYSSNQVYKYIRNSNLPIRHPFYTEYEPLRQICLQVLKKSGVGLYGGNGEKIEGIVFDVAWLWETFIYKKVLSKMPNQKFKHCKMEENDGIKYFVEDSDNKYQKFYPDFLSMPNHRAVFDTKYKSVWEKSRLSSDIHQLFSYMYITGAKVGGVIYPVPSTSSDNNIESKTISTPFNKINGDAKFYKIPFVIPNTDVDIIKFKNKMDVNISSWMDEVQGIIK